MTIAHSTTHSVPVLDFYFLSEYLQAKQEDCHTTSHFYYLERKNVALLKAGRTPSIILSEGTQDARPPLLTFMMVEHPKSFEMPFYMVLNIQSHEALLVTIGGNQEQGIAAQPWFQAIWKAVVRLFGWSENHIYDPTILYGNWIMVCVTPLMR
jgi:hypothetical protein